LLDRGVRISAYIVAREHRVELGVAILWVEVPQMENMRMCWRSRRIGIDTVHGRAVGGEARELQITSHQYDWTAR
jgi:hypothetical protein